MASDSPVAPDSSHLTLWPRRKTPSTGIISPGSRRAMSPTSSSYRGEPQVSKQTNWRGRKRRRAHVNTDNLLIT